LRSVNILVLSKLIFVGAFPIIISSFASLELRVQLLGTKLTSVVMLRGQRSLVISSVTPVALSVILVMNLIG